MFLDQRIGFPPKVEQKGEDDTGSVKLIPPNNSVLYPISFIFKVAQKIWNSHQRRVKI